MLTLIFTHQEMTYLSRYGLGMLAFFYAPLMIYEIWLEQKHTLGKVDFDALRTEWRERWAERTIKAMEITLKAALTDGVRQRTLANNPLEYLKTISAKKFYLPEK